MSFVESIRKKHHVWVLGFILLVAALLRILYFVELTGAPDFGNPQLDEAYHDYWARLTISKDAPLPKGVSDPMIANTPYFRPPGYPVFLSIIYRLSSHPMTPRAIQMAMGVLSCLLAFALAKKWFNKYVGLIYAGLIGFSWIFIYHEGKLLAESLLAPLTLSLLYLLARLVEKTTLKRSFAAGLLLGVYALVRPNILPVAAFATIWIWWISFRRDKGCKYRKPTLAALAFVLGTLVAISPATIRNYLVAKDLVLVSANGGINLFFGNNKDSTGIEAWHASVGSWSCFDYPRIVKDLETKLQRPVPYSKASAYFAQQAFRFIMQNPAKATQLTAKKAALFWGPMEISNEGDIKLDRYNSNILGYLPLPFSMTMALALTGIILFIVKMRRTPDKSLIEVAILLAGFVAVYSTTTILFFICARLRIPLIPILFFFASYGLYRIGSFMINGKKGDAIMSCIAVVSFYCVIQAQQDNQYIRPHIWHLNRGIAMWVRNQCEEAILEFKAALKAKPNHPHILYVLGRAHVRQRNDDKAFMYLSQAVQYDPTHLQARIELGKCFRNKQRVEEAAEQFKSALEISPASAEAHACMGYTLMLLCQHDKGIEHLETAVNLQPNRLDARMSLGVAHMLEGNVDAAIEQFSAIVRYDPEYPSAKALLHKAQTLRTE